MPMGNSALLAHRRRKGKRRRRRRGRGKRRRRIINLLIRYLYD